MYSSQIRLGQIMEIRAGEETIKISFNKFQRGGFNIKICAPPKYKIKKKKNEERRLIEGYVKLSSHD